VFKRDNWRCVYCGAPATQVHQKRYARINIGAEPIDWLVSICKSCHDAIHQKKKLRYDFNKQIKRQEIIFHYWDLMNQRQTLRFKREIKVTIPGSNRK
jgi:formate-dependent nitrite reductase cytochrome c552 subunit